MKGKKSYALLTAIGAALLAAGLFLLKAEKGGAGLAPYLCIGFGCGVFGHGVGEAVSRRCMQRSPEEARRLEIEQNDERNVALRDRAQAKAYRLMLPVYGALFVAFGLMGVEMRVILLLTAAYLFLCGCSVYYRLRYEREM